MCWLCEMRAQVQFMMMVQTALIENEKAEAVEEAERIVEGGSGTGLQGG